MAQIRDELILVDRFTNTMTTYIRLADQAAGESESVTRAARRMAESQETAASSTSILNSQMGNLLKTYLGFQGVKMMVGLSDQMTQATARLDRMNDGLQETEELQQMIFDSAQRSRGSYLGTLEMVSKLGTMAGDAFDSNEELVAFAEQINKQITLSGASTQAADAAMLQLTQAMSSGVLRGEELNSILEQTPTIAQTIAEYLGVSTGEMREMASEGQVTAEVVKAAMFSAAEETNAAFEDIPLTWGQVWTMMQNTAIMALQPILDAIGWLANNIDIVGPLVLGVTAAFLVYLAATQGVTAAVKVFTAVQAALNAVMALNPIFLVVMAVSLLIGLFYAAVAAVNKFAGTSYSATGLIAGAFAALGAFLFNTFIVPVQNAFAYLADFIGNFMNEPVAAVKVLFLDMANWAIGKVLSIAQAVEGLINAIPGMEVDITSGLEGLQGFIQDATQQVKDEAGWKEYMEKWGPMDIKSAFQSGYDWGSNLFSGSGSSIPDWDALADNVSQMAGDTKSIKNSVSMAQEDVKMIVDMAERQFVAQVNLTTAAPTITINGRGGTSRAQDNHILGELGRMLGGQSSASARLSTAQTR